MLLSKAKYCISTSVPHSIPALTIVSTFLTANSNAGASSPMSIILDSRSQNIDFSA